MDVIDRSESMHHQTPQTTGNKLTANECICCLKVRKLEMNVFAGLYDCVFLSVPLVKYVKPVDEFQ